MRVISWPGCKHRQIKSLLKYSNGVSGPVCEPFLGSGAFTLELLAAEPRPVYAAEACAPLRNWWTWMLKSPREMIIAMAKCREYYARAREDRKVFNQMRDTWNYLWADTHGGLDAAALLWCLIYQSTNNLARFNSHEEYNQTWGKGRVVPDPVKVFGDPMVRTVLERMAWGVQKGCLAEDYRDALDLYLEHGGGGICYLDPPYIVQTETYNRSCWVMKDAADLITYLEKLDGAEGMWLYTDFLRKGEKVHPYADTLLSRYQVIPLARGVDPRPNGRQITAEEVIVLGGKAISMHTDH